MDLFACFSWCFPTQTQQTKFAPTIRLTEDQPLINGTGNLERQIPDESSVEENNVREWNVGKLVDLLVVNGLYRDIDENIQTTISEGERKYLIASAMRQIENRRIDEKYGLHLIFGAESDFLLRPTRDGRLEIMTVEIGDSGEIRKNSTQLFINHNVNDFLNSEQ